MALHSFLPFLIYLNSHDFSEKIVEQFSIAFYMVFNSVILLIDKLHYHGQRDQSTLLFTIERWRRNGFMYFPTNNIQHRLSLAHYCSVMVKKLTLKIISICSDLTGGGSHTCGLVPNLID